MASYRIEKCRYFWDPMHTLSIIITEKADINLSYCGCSYCNLWSRHELRPMLGQMCKRPSPHMISVTCK